jgi:hypothetical protein
MIQIKKSHEGKLHRALGVKPGRKITVAALDKAAHSKSEALRKEAQFALNARKWNK